MSRIVRKQLLSIGEALKEANQELRNMIYEKHWEEMTALLTECQEAAITMGNAIEAVFGVGHETVRCLEEYCETIYHIAEHIGSPEESIKYLMQADGQLAAVEKLMEAEIPDRLEIAFFPCRAAEWDCLHSIYMAARQDKDCDAYCVPIPYYSLSPDGTWGESYEGNEDYPQDVQITGWNEYEFEVRKPDIIFIHDAKDGMGTDGRTDPRFYSDNLRGYTERLVYVPHYVLTDIKSDMRNGLERMRRSCAWPGIAFADTVIVESEAMSSLYKNEYIKNLDAKGIMADQTELDQKIIALGTPKTDEAAEADSRDIVMPAEWKEILLHPDGKRKKAVLYQISINNLLSEGEALLDKLDNVLMDFKEKREVALWWRTPCLIKDMLQKMRPELWDRYRKTAEEYKRQGWGIYDDTDDQVRAIAATDAYYGDWNSVIWTYEESGKPVMLQNKEIFKYADKMELQLLSFGDGLREKDGIWFSDITLNGLFKMSLMDWECEFIGRFEEEAGVRKLHRQIINYQEWLILIPEKAGKVTFFHKQTHEMEYVNVVLPKNNKNGVQASGAYIFGDRLFIFPCILKQAIAVIGLKDREVRYDYALREKIGTLKDLDVNEPFFGQAAMQEDMVWLPVRDTAKIACYRLTDRKVEIYRLEDRKYRIQSIDAAGNRFWLTSAETSEIMEWSPSEGVRDAYTVDIPWEKGKNPFSKIIPVSEKECIILPAYAEEIVYKAGDTFRKLEYPQGFRRLEDFRKSLPLFGGCRRESNQLFIFPLAGNMLLTYDIQTGLLEGKSCMVPAGWDAERIMEGHVRPYFMREYVEGYKPAYEEQKEDLDSFLYWAMNHERYKAEENIGEKIYRFFTEDE